MTKYKLIEQLGLRVRDRDVEGYIVGDYVRAADLEALLEKATVVYGNKYDWQGVIQRGDTHQALLLPPKPIEKKCEVHEPINEYCNPTFKCKHCGVKLIADWKAVKS